MVESNSTDLAIVVINGEACQRTKMSGDTGNFPLQNVSNAAKKIQGIARGTAERTKESQLKGNGTAQWFKTGWQDLGQRLK